MRKQIERLQQKQKKKQLQGSTGEQIERGAVEEEDRALEAETG